MHGLEHAIKLAEGTKTGQFSRQSHAIRTEYTKLKLLAEQNMTKPDAPQSSSWVSWMGGMFIVLSILCAPVLVIGFISLVTQ